MLTTRFVIMNVKKAKGLVIMAEVDEQMLDDQRISHLKTYFDLSRPALLDMMEESKSKFYISDLNEQKGLISPTQQICVAVVEGEKYIHPDEHDMTSLRFLKSDFGLDERYNRNPNYPEPDTEAQA